MRAPTISWAGAGLIRASKLLLLCRLYSSVVLVGLSLRGCWPCLRHITIIEDSLRRWRIDTITVMYYFRGRRCGILARLLQLEHRYHI